MCIEGIAGGLWVSHAFQSPACNPPSQGSHPSSYFFSFDHSNVNFKLGSSVSSHLTKYLAFCPVQLTASIMSSMKHLFSSFEDMSLRTISLNSGEGKIFSSSNFPAPRQALSHPLPEDIVQLKTQAQKTE